MDNSRLVFLDLCSGLGGAKLHGGITYKIRGARGFATHVKHCKGKRKMSDDIETESECGHPCASDEACDECAGYWERMRAEGLWKNGRWTDKDWRDIL